MKKTSFFQRQLIVSLVATIILVLGGFALSFEVIHHRHELEREKENTNPVVFLGSTLEGIAKVASLEKGLEIISKSNGPFSNSKLILLNARGEILAANSDSADLGHTFPLKVENLPKKVGEFSFLQGSDNGPQAPTVYHLDSTPAKYLVFIPTEERDRKHRHGPWAEFPVMVLFVLAGSLLSAIMSFGVLFYYLRKNSLVLEGVMEEIHRGNLKARVPVKRFDEVGQVMTKFNQMAAEIEELVKRVREQEAGRINLLQELGHDLRTPLASLSNVLETLESKVESMTDEQKREIASMSFGEVKYLSRLVEDLLFLARVDDPKYLKQGTAVDCAALLEDEADRIRLAPGARPLQLTIENNTPPGFKFFADPHLIKRLLRNAVDNASTYAQSKIVIRAGLDSAMADLCFEIIDDGPGYTADQLANFGIKRASRSFDPPQDKRISLGLGSVIMKAIVNAHQGSLEVENLTNGDGKPRGAKLTLHIPMRA